MTARGSAFPSFVTQAAHRLMVTTSFWLLFVGSSQVSISRSLAVVTCNRHGFGSGTTYRRFGGVLHASVHVGDPALAVPPTEVVNG